MSALTGSAGDPVVVCYLIASNGLPACKRTAAWVLGTPRLGHDVCVSGRLPLESLQATIVASTKRGDLGRGPYVRALDRGCRLAIQSGLGISLGEPQPLVQPAIEEIWVPEDAVAYTRWSGQ